ncbi:hypothetical protein IL306_012930 [Fusarium sp. DS 682]|nr:hypothetical protein IL306_012930 [Fusarium sp. DS 682]
MSLLIERLSLCDLPPSTSPTQASSRIEPDVFDDDGLEDEFYPESTNTSYLTSIASDIRRGVERNDLQHCKFTMLMGNELHLAPISDHPQKILDLGTGSGIWAIDMAEQYPSAKVIGVDTTPVQPNIDDVEDDWLWGEGTFDLIHGRELIMAIRD